MDRRQLARATFDTVAERYDRVRPHYPRDVFDDIDGIGGLAPGSRVLEIGCGTGQATIDLATRGHEVVAIELGASMAAVARRNLAGFDKTEVVEADFESWDLPDAPFDAVVSASAFHWIDPEPGFAKVADALAPGGAMAIIAVDQIAGGTEPFFVEVQNCYEQWDSTTEPGLRLPSASAVAVDMDEVARSGRFEPVLVRQYEWEQSYSRLDFVELLLTYSDNLLLEPDVRDGLMGCIGTLIDSRYGGSVTKRYLATLRLARRLA
jgi:SAM-dependent methyltransferase